MQEDGVVFDPGTVRAERIKEDADYQGVRVHVVARLGQAKARLQIDVGFGDVVTPKILKAAYPTLLDAEPLKLWCYPFETVVAEKFEAMIKLSVKNSRMKDFYDLHHLATTREFDGALLQAAMARTFECRGTGFEPGTLVLGDDFRVDPARQAQWAGYLRKAKLGDAPDSFAAAMQVIATFAGRIYLACASRELFALRWTPHQRRWSSA